MSAGHSVTGSRSASGADVGQLATMITSGSISHGSPQHLDVSAAIFQAVEGQGLAASATQVANGAVCDNLRKLAWAVIRRATKGTEEARATAQIVLRCIEKRNFIEFLELLLENIVIMFRNRGHLMPSEPTVDPRGWTGYVLFVAELVHGLACWSGSVSTAASAAAASTAPAVNLVAEDLGRLVCYCGLVMLRAPSLGHPEEVECLRSVLATAGVSLQRHSPEAMTVLTRRLRHAVGQPDVPENSRPALADMLSIVSRLDGST